MSNGAQVKVTEIIGHTLCVTSSDGQKVFAVVAERLKQGTLVEISFENATAVTSAFLNAAIGQLYGTLAPDTIREKLRILNMGQEDLSLLKRVVETAKAYFKDPQRINQARKDALDTDVDG